VARSCSKMFGWSLLLLLLVPTLLPAQALRDPTRPPGDYLPPSLIVEATTELEEETDEEMFDWRLEATFTSSLRRRALISGITVTVGDEIGGAVVTNIGPGRVELNYKGEVIGLPLQDTKAKKPPLEDGTSQ
jgi:hypothetical protein